MDKRTRERLEKLAAHAHKTGSMMGRGAAFESRKEIEGVAYQALELGVPSKFYVYLEDPQKVAIWCYNFYLGWRSAAGAGGIYEQPTIDVPPADQAAPTQEEREP